MRTLPQRRAPFWFECLVVLALAVAVRQVDTLHALVIGHGRDAGHPQQAFWFFIGLIVSAIWKGLEVAGRVTLTVLSYSVTALWRFANFVAKGVHEIADFSWTALRKGWDLLKWTYTSVLKPAWLKVWRFIDRTERWLENLFSPVIGFLRWLRDWVLDIYTKFVRPVLDIIEATRRALRVLSSLGVDWARALDARLGAIEAAIERPFRLVVAKINEIVNLVNRIMTADGLFQRLAFVRTLARDYKQAWNQLMWGYHHPIPDDLKRNLFTALKGKPIDNVRKDISDYLKSGTGADATLINAVSARLRARLGT